MKKYSQIFLFVVLLFALFLNLSCKKTPVGPPPSPANDTTSHAFTFQQFTWGGGGASSINDVAILSDTNIWCVGEIQLVSYCVALPAFFVSVLLNKKDKFFLLTSAIKLPAKGSLTPKSLQQRVKNTTMFAPK